MRLSVASLRWVVKRDLPISSSRRSSPRTAAWNCCAAICSRSICLGASAERWARWAATTGTPDSVCWSWRCCTSGGRRPEHLQYVAGDPLVRRFCGLARVPTARTVAATCQRSPKQSHPGSPMESQCGDGDRTPLVSVSGSCRGQLAARLRRVAVCFLVCSARKLAPVISTKWAPWVRRSRAAEASSASPKRSGHSARSRLLVRRIEAFSYRSLMTS